jgi:hypothetical protein
MKHSCRQSEYGSFSFILPLGTAHSGSRQKKENVCVLMDQTVVNAQISLRKCGKKSANMNGGRELGGNGDGVGGRGREGEEKGVELGAVPFESSNSCITLMNQLIDTKEKCVAF